MYNERNVFKKYPNYGRKKIALKGIFIFCTTYNNNNNNNGNNI